MSARVALLLSISRPEWHFAPRRHYNANLPELAGVAFLIANLPWI
jgi:hypothetical protein